jgi:hypothetical protein
VATRTVKTTMVYTHVNFSTPPLSGAPGLRSPASRFRRVGLNKS